ncbi:4Fe-4S binding protein [Clostridium aestuarii]|uniref:4Fe-4S binding protein n=1 Tax=Clostridium aestuarii TaxID=338193 RepID=A0ABT4CZS0_9CLOT|nr:[Fe-Fe] hydrogenase large subunit C-terminal domain-containing protein [Clostridium aestuarii]MCY6484484.1 4Fe-4S binding protein [Clostridium aestuarii]
MNYINFSKASCKNCYKCLRSCPVKAIRFKNQQAEIVEERCIACGHCLEVCPQNAREIINDLDIVKGALISGKKVIVSIAPSFMGYMNVEEGKVVAGLKKIGFTTIEETAIGADAVTRYYKEYLQKNNIENYITTACPSANYMIEKYYPGLIKYMIPIDSPMIAHGKILKSIYGSDCFIVFIGPCAAKKIEADEYRENIKDVIDAVLTFDEIKMWLQEKNIDLNSIKSEKFNKNSFKQGAGFPVKGGIIKALEDVIDEKSLETISVSGTNNCIKIFESMKKGNIKGAFIEINVCEGSCVGGPNSTKYEDDYYTRLHKVKEYIKRKKKSINLQECSNEELNTLELEIDFSTSFRDKTFKDRIPSEEDIRRIMNEMGKFESEDELNCGVCGYNTCRKKAEAIFKGMAETDMCLHFMRSKAESLSNVIVESTESSIILVDRDMKIKEINPAAQEVFMVKSENIKGKPVSLLMRDEDIRRVKETGKSIIGKKDAYPQYNAVFIKNIVYLPKQNVVLVSMINVVESEMQRKELIKVKENTLNVAQEVIEKQMRVAQEIAGLLGETTAETKVILNKLRKVVAGE